LQIVWAEVQPFGEEAEGQILYRQALHSHAYLLA
jgi:hypothetical protein